MHEKKKNILAMMETLRPLCEQTAEELWAHPELGGTEKHSSDLFRQRLTEEGFRIVNEEKLPYAFYAEYGSGHPVIAVLGEYDALPGLSQKCQTTKEPVEAGAPGHGCGHNLLGSAALTAAIGIRRFLEEEKLPGTVRFYGCPEEELLSGKVNFAVGDSISETCRRENPFEKKPFAVHFCRGTKATVTALEDSQVLVQMTDNARTWAPEFYHPGNCLYQEFGKGQWNGTGHRIVATMFDLDNAPQSNLVMGEVFNQPGRWSSYPPHYHPQPEVYYYQFDHPEGFGAGFEGDTPYKTQNGDCLCIRGGNAHQQVTAPGYEMYYVWLIRHLDGDPWDKTRIYVPEYEWLANAD